MSNKNIYLIDGHAYIFRAFYAFERQGLRASDGTPTWALYGYLSLLLKLLENSDGYVAAIFDAKGPSFRKEIYDAYKANRPEPPDELKIQIPYCMEITKLAGIPVFSIEGFEADDIIATITKKVEKQGYNVIIYSSDKDLMQLVSEKVRLYDSMRNIIYDSKAVKEKFGVEPDQIGDFLALMGDSSDNIPGVVGIGKKGAAKLLATYKNLENILNTENLKGKIAEKIQNGRKNALLSRKLVELDYNVKLNDFKIPDSLALQESDFPKLKNILEELGFGNIVLKIEKYINTNSKNNRNTNQSTQNSKIKQKFSIITTRKELKNLKIDKNFGIRLVFDNKKYSNPTAVLFISNQDIYYVPFKSQDMFEEGLSVEETFEIMCNLLDEKTVLTVFNTKKLLTDKNTKKIIKSKNNIRDLHIMSYLLNPNVTHSSFDDFIENYAGNTCSKYLKQGKHRQNIKELSKKTLEECFVNEAEGFIYVAKILNDQIYSNKENINLYENIELPLAFVLAEMENTGVLIDVIKLNKLSFELHNQLNKLKKEINEVAGYNINPNSPKQLGKLLFEELKLPTSKKTKTGYSTDNEVLIQLEPYHPIIEKINEYRMISKLLGTYIDAFPKLVNPITKRIHTHYNQTIAATGRLSSSEPNLQNIPVKTEAGRKIREAFTAPKGCFLVSFDYSQIELRVLAHLSDDPTLKSSFKNNLDVHSITASEIFNKSEDNITKTERRIAKAVNFGVIYGQSGFGLAKMLGISREDANLYIETYFKKYPRVKEYMDQVIETARKNGYVETMIGRKRQLPFVKGKKSKNLERMAMNTPIQGSAADIIKLAMIKCDNLIKNKYIKAKMILTVHDELVFEISENQIESFIKDIKEIMENIVELSIPLKVDVGYGKNWEEAH